MEQDTPESKRLSLAMGSEVPVVVTPDAPLHDRVIAYLATVAPGTSIRPLCIPRSLRVTTVDPRQLQVMIGDTSGVHSGVFRRTRLQGWGWIAGAADVHGHLVPFSGPAIERAVTVSTEGLLSPLEGWKLGAWLWPNGIALADDPDSQLTPGPQLHDRLMVLLGRTDLGPRGHAELDGIYTVFAEPESDHWSGVPLVDGRRRGEGPVASAAARAVWGEEPRQRPSLEGASPPVAPIMMNRTQRRAVMESRDAALTVISGPPGTGKTHLLAAIALEQLAAGRNALLVSASRTAVDAVDSMLRRFPAVTAIRFDAQADPVLLGNQLADGTDDGDPRFSLPLVERALADIDLRADELHDRITARLRTAASGGSGIAEPVHDELRGRYFELRDLVAGAKRPGVRHIGTRRSALKALRAAFGDSASSLADLEGRVDMVAAAMISADDAPISELWASMDHLEVERFEAAATVLEARRRSSASPRARRSLGNLAGALRQSPPDRRNILWSADENFLGAAPLWFGTLDAVHPTLPHQPEGFDLVVFDEASQISQIDAWPALERAKRVVVIGDSRQLRHVQHATGADHEAAADAVGLSADELHAHHEETMSLFDVAAQRSPAIRLEEHFRSSPHIIGFSSERFYEGRLDLMTNHPSREARDAIHIEEVALTEQETAHRSRSPEISATARLLQELLDFGFTSIGVIAANEDMRDPLKAALGRMSSAGRAPDVRVGTVPEFQGLEFDATIIVVGVMQGEWNRLRAVEEPTAFNVMVTRARRDVHVVTSLDRRELPEGLLRDYLAWSEQPLPALQGAVDASGWTGELARDLDETAELRVVTNYPVGGHQIDIVIGTGIGAIGIETTVHPDGPQAHVERHLALRRAGWTLLDALEHDWAARKGECAPWLIAQWKRRLGAG